MRLVLKARLRPNNGVKAGTDISGLKERCRETRTYKEKMTRRIERKKEIWEREERKDGNREKVLWLRCRLLHRL